MKRILYIGGFEMSDKNAAAQRVMANALLLREMGFDVMFIGISKDIVNAPKEVDGFKSFPQLYPSNTRQWFHQIMTFFDVDKILAEKPDYVVLYNFPSIASLKILKACHKQGIKVFHDLTEWESADGWSLRNVFRKFDINIRMRYCIKKMDGLICISRFLYDYYKKYTICVLVPPTVDLQAEKWNRGRLLTSGENIKLVYAGNAGFGNKDKLDVIIDALKAFPSIKLTVIGMTEEQYVQGYGSLPADCKNVEFRGRVSHAEAVKAVCDADFQMLIRDNTLKNRAGFPTKFVESMSCCTPLIATLTSNISDYLKDGENGFVVDGEQTLTKVFSRILGMESKDIVAMKQNCRNFIGFDYRYYKSEIGKLFQ